MFYVQFAFEYLDHTSLNAQYLILFFYWIYYEYSSNGFSSSLNLELFLRNLERNDFCTYKWAGIWVIGWHGWSNLADLQRAAHREAGKNPWKSIKKNSKGLFLVCDSIMRVVLPEGLICLWKIWHLNVIVWIYQVMYGFALISFISYLSSLLLHMKVWEPSIFCQEFHFVMC